ncbi:P-loop containing nucleoside triphosphate hydrolase protein [Russula brevipes]|nr:P-loop containing nucleoside triphosphate hydrolase protein [Russula brevipes]
MAPLLAVKNLSCVRPEGDPIFVNVDFNVNEGDIVVLRARSGTGKTTLLKCIAHLNLYRGTVEFRGKPRLLDPPELTVSLRTGHTSSIYPTTFPVTGYTTRSSRDAVHVPCPTRPRTVSGDHAHLHNSMVLAEQWGIARELWDRPWSLLSVGEAQRLSLAIAHGLNRAEVLMLDEPTSGLDAATSAAVENTLINEIKDPDSTLKAIIWITHSEEQAERVGTRFLRLTPTGVQERHQVEP